jgi:hypothetical protein
MENILTPATTASLFNGTNRHGRGRADPSGVR